MKTITEDWKRLETFCLITIISQFYVPESLFFHENFRNPKVFKNRSFTSEFFIKNWAIWFILLKVKRRVCNNMLNSWQNSA